MEQKELLNNNNRSRETGAKSTEKYIENTTIVNQKHR